MNYNDVVNRFKTIVEDHRMLVDFGYGQISDIKTRSEGMGELEGADYPYLFLNPGVHNRDQSTITYNFNMIIMDMAREEEASEYQNFLNIQSNCIQYCDDVIARLYYYYKDKPEVSFNISYTPFYERFQDDLAGATATISITVPNNIDDCISPFNDYRLTNYVMSNPAGEDQTPYCAISETQDLINWPQYTKQSNGVNLPFDVTGPYDGELTAPDVINLLGDTTKPFWNRSDREIKFPIGVGGDFKINMDFLMNNVQGVDLSQDILQVRISNNGGILYQQELPYLPVDGTYVTFDYDFTYYSDPAKTELIYLSFYLDTTPGAQPPVGPLVGYTGSMSIFKEESNI